MVETKDDIIAQKVEEISEGVMFRTYRKSEAMAIILIEKSNENIVKMIATMLYQVVLGLYEDYYNVRKGRNKAVWEKKLKGHIVILKKACEILVYYNIVSRDDIDSFVYEDSISDDVDFPRVTTVATSLLRQLHEFDTMAIFRC